MGVTLFIVITIAAIYWLIAYFRSLSNDLPAFSSRRQTVSLDYLRSSMPAKPVVTPVDQVKILERLPQISPDLMPSLADPPAPIDLLKYYQILLPPRH